MPKTTGLRYFIYKVGKEVHLKRRRRLGGIRVLLQNIQHPYKGSPRKGHRRNEIAQKIIQENFQELKDKLPDESTTKSGIKMS